MKAARGYRHGTRRKLKRGVRDKFKPEDYLKEFKAGQTVALTPNSSSQKGMPHPRFSGKVGKVVSKRGNSYIVTFLDCGKRKQVIARPEHLRRI